MLQDVNLLGTLTNDATWFTWGASALSRSADSRACGVRPQDRSGSQMTNDNLYLLALFVPTYFAIFNSILKAP
ncbi:hypothetical protein I8748_29905 [Nostoc sp. CENA67]|uniref:Uncharacterized protein n=1 Tax=Amazonocrinis nigriterrae CENA67 TaxID=2794033 RepID=A0A8J7LB54_9NOST|nr:hypothetical protein [Amazonocrinis nigriterrae]MBH8566318.1 hypothetical protein [Amazonocrinis nigriterrae CENA67]